MPYFIVSIPAIVLFTFFFHRPNLGNDFYTHSIVRQIFEFYITGSHVAAFWFIPMITLFYLISPVLARLDKDERIYYFIPLFIIVSILIPRGQSVLHNFTHFFSIYLIGMCSSRYKDKIFKITEKGKYFNALLAMYCLSVLISILNVPLQIPVYILNYFSKLLLSIVLISVLYRYDYIIQKRGGFLASISFGIYFVHNYILFFIKFLTSGHIMTTTPFDGSVLRFLLFFVFVVVSCSLIIILIKGITGKYSKNIIGC